MLQSFMMKLSVLSKNFSLKPKVLRLQQLTLQMLKTVMMVAVVHPIKYPQLDIVKLFCCDLWARLNR